MLSESNGKIPTKKEIIEEAKQNKKTVIELISLDFEDIRISNESFMKYRIAEFCCAYLIVVQIGSAVIVNEVNHFNHS